MTDTISIEVRGAKQARDKMRQVAEDLHGGEMVNAMTRATLVIERKAKKNAPVDTGQLRNSITHAVESRGFMNPRLVGIVGTNVKHGCIYDAHTRVITREGTKTISQICVGDYVLSQDGEYHRVNNVYAFPVEEKPDLVTIKVQRCKGQISTIKVTHDHKILAYRDGRNKWIHAGDLELTDKLYLTRKIPHNIGAAEVKTCANCGKQFTGQNPVYCSWECKQEDWHDKGNNPHIGMERSEETRDNISQMLVQRFIDNPELHPNRVLAKRDDKTTIEYEVQSWIENNGYEYESQKYIAGKFVDFYVPALHTIYEADGAYWHRDQQVDIERDKIIARAMPGVKIIHIHFYEKRFSPILHMNPLPNVYYVAVNPSMKSYVDLDSFELKDIISIDKWTAKQKSKYARGVSKEKRGRFRARIKVGDKLIGLGSYDSEQEAYQAYCDAVIEYGIQQKDLLYDLSVEDVHSFTTNSIIVSNSWMEQGTGTPAGNPPVKMPPVEALSGWARRHGINPYLVARAIALRGGLEPRHYLLNAINDSEREIMNILQTGVRIIIDK